MPHLPLTELKRIQALLRGTVANVEHYRKALAEVGAEITRQEDEAGSAPKLSDVGDEHYSSLYKSAIDALEALKKFHLESCATAENESVAHLHQSIHDKYGKYSEQLARIHEGDFSGLGE